MSLLTANDIIKNPYSQSLILFAFLYLLLPSHFTSDISCETVEQCLDPSWMLTLHWAIQKKMIFGKEYVFTYGPLGFLSTRTLFGISRFYLLIFDLFVIANLLFILRYAIRKYNSIYTLLFCLLIVLITSSKLMYRDGIVFILLLISVFWLNYALKYRFIWIMVIPSFVTVLLFYIKVNISLIALVIFYGYLIYYLLIEKKNKLGKILIGLMLPGLIFLSSVPLKTDLPGYLQAGFNFVDGYNDAMNTGIGEYRLCTAIAIVIVFFCLILFFTRQFKKDIPVFVTYCIFSYVLFKQSFVRSDLHILIFFALLPAFIGIAALFFGKHSLFAKIALVSVCIVCYAIGLSLNDYSNPLNKYEYLINVFSAHESENFESKAHLFKLPPAILDKIGQKTVDVIPGENILLYFNKLNYNPRPVVQSYAVYTPYLSSLNYEKYVSDTAPESLIVSNQSIDGRYAFSDDQKVKLSLITDYYCDAAFKSQNFDYLLFQRKPKNAFITISPPNEEIIKIGEDYTLKDRDKVYFIKMDIQYSLMGKALRFAYKPFIIWIIFTLEDGSEHRHRVVVPIYKDGIIVNPYIEKESDLFNFVRGDRLNEKKIKSFKFEVSSSTALLNYVAVKSYNEAVKLSVSELSIDRTHNQ